MSLQYGFIGCGNMGGALAKAAARAVPREEIRVAEKDSGRLTAFVSETGMASGTNEELAAESKFLFLGVKPQVLPELLRQLAPVLADRKEKVVLVSMAAGISTEKVQSWAGGSFPVIRIMPNLPVSVGEGMILYCTRGEVTEEDLAGFLSVMRCAGKLCPLEEKLIDAGSAVSGCGPAYAYLFIEALADGGVQCGLPREKATLLAAQTLLGAAALLLESGKHPGELKDAVCSPGGTTIAGVHALEKGAFRGIAAEAVLAAYEKTLALGK